LRLPLGSGSPTGVPADPEVPIRIDGENLTLAEAASLVAELAEHNPERRYVVLPIRCCPHRWVSRIIRKLRTPFYLNN
jgi:hypothetical protein